ncbi:hypothetical protein [Sandaracinus amylolyticus]|uniref:hypothetical protein n=1 Tax=Sandaracinus amylolyticus TaxID=927083 RepID=UPI001F1D4760|nr:hypothetical protein [Sandaracinus amylolyticus]UJR86673.1 Hypothetical protein I5071_87740 [Sandaracinus amylolyticus]
MPEIIHEQPVMPDGPTLIAALEAKREILINMPASEVLHSARLDARTAAGVVGGSLPRIARHRVALIAEFGERARTLLDDLPTVVYATYQVAYDVQATEDDSDMRELHRGVLEEHQLLVGDLDALANRKIIDRARIDAGRSTQGYRTTVDSTFVLLSLTRSLWPTIEGRTLLTQVDLERIQAKAQAMLDRLNQREQGATRMPARELRDRALTLLVRTYDEIRRMLTFVRWPQGDADEIAPSLYARRGRRQSGTDTDGPDEDVEPTPAPTPIVVEGPNNGGGPFAP